MTRKDYIRIAAAIRVAFESDGYPSRAECAIRECVVTALSTALAADNPQFQADKFRRECGL